MAYVNEHETIANTEEYCSSTGISKEDLEPVLKSLSVEEYLKLSVLERKEIELTDEGKGYAQNGSPEF